jgi:hypothetical protein
LVIVEIGKAISNRYHRAAVVRDTTMA